MTQMRRLLGPLTAIWLLCQVGTVTLVPIGLWMSATDPHAATCICGHGAGAICPMHHKPAGGSAPCAMKAANDSTAAVLTPVAAIAGLIPESPVSIGPAQEAALVAGPAVRVIGRRPVPPDPPPPRA